MREELAGLFSGDNGAWVEALYEDYVLGHDSVPESWRALFERLHGRETAPVAAPAEPVAPVRANGHAPAAELGREPVVGIAGLVDAYRSHGHLIARLDPLGTHRDEHPLLDPAVFDLASWDPQRRFSFGNYLAKGEGTLPELVASLRHTYSGTFGAEFMEIRDKERRDWLIQRMEPRENQQTLMTIEHTLLPPDLVDEHERGWAAIAQQLAEELAP